MNGLCPLKGKKKSGKGESVCHFWDAAVMNLF